MLPAAPLTSQGANNTSRVQGSTSLEAACTPGKAPADVSQHVAKAHSPEAHVQRGRASARGATIRQGLPGLGGALTHARAGHQGQAHSQRRQGAVAGLVHTTGVHCADQDEGHEGLPAAAQAHNQPPAQKVSWCLLRPGGSALPDCPLPSTPHPLAGCGWRTKPCSAGELQAVEVAELCLAAEQTQSAHPKIWPSLSSLLMVIRSKQPPPPSPKKMSLLGIRPADRAAPAMAPVHWRMT